MNFDPLIDIAVGAACVAAIIGVPWGIGKGVNWAFFRKEPCTPHWLFGAILLALAGFLGALGDCIRRG